MITVLVESPDVDILAHKGALMRVSPEELVHAAIFICADEVTANVPEERLQRWKSIFPFLLFLLRGGGSWPGHVLLEGLQPAADHRCHLRRVQEECEADGA